MKKLVMLTALICCFVFNADAQKARSKSETTTDARSVIAQLERDNDRATLKGDGATLESLYADDFAGVSSNGSATTKEQIVSYYSKSKVSGARINQSDQTDIRIYDKTAVVTARLKYQNKEDDEISMLKYTRIYIFRENRWLIVAEHYCILENGAQ